MKILKLIASIIISLAAGGIGAIFSASAIPTWYATLAKPSFNPPNWLFGPAWTIFYLLMGISVYLVWTSAVQNKKIAYLAFFIQLILNALWSAIFFGFHALGLALGEIIILWLAIGWTIIAFNKISKTASCLLIPYILWVTFAAILNFAVYRLN